MHNSIGAKPAPSYYRGIKTRYFYLFFWAWVYYTVASVDPNCSASCIAALRSLGFLDCTQAYMVG